MPKYKCRATMGTELYCIVEAKDKHDAYEQMKELASNGDLIEENNSGFVDYDPFPSLMPDDTDLEPEFEEGDNA